MAIKQENVTVNGTSFVKLYSDNYKKIQYSKDMNIYSIVYVVPGTYEISDFKETTISVPQIASGTIVSTSDIYDIQTQLSSSLSSQILKVLDVSDGTEDDFAVINGGGVD